MPRRDLALPLKSCLTALPERLSFALNRLAPFDMSTARAVNFVLFQLGAALLSLLLVASPAILRRLHHPSDQRCAWRLFRVNRILGNLHGCASILGNM